MDSVEKYEMSIQALQDLMMFNNQPTECPFCGRETLIPTNCGEFGPKYMLHDDAGKLLKYLYQGRCMYCNKLFYTEKGIGTQKGIRENSNVYHLFE